MSMNHALKSPQLLLECRLQDVSAWHFPAPALFVVPIQKTWLSWEWGLCTTKNWYPSIMELKYESLISPHTLCHLARLWSLLVSLQLPKVKIFHKMLIFAKRWWNFKGELNTSNMYLVDSVENLRCLSSSLNLKSLKLQTLCSPQWVDQVSAYLFALPAVICWTHGVSCSHRGQPKVWAEFMQRLWSAPMWFPSYRGLLPRCPATGSPGPHSLISRDNKDWICLVWILAVPCRREWGISSGDKPCKCYACPLLFLSKVKPSLV